MRTAIALMGEQGYDGTSTRDIANAAGVSVAALYYHFPSKLDLLSEFLHEAHDVVLRRLAHAIGDAGDSARDQLDAVVATLLMSNLHDEWAQLASKVAWREHGRLDHGGQQAIATKRAEIVDMLERILGDGRAEGEFTTTDVHEVARAILTLCMSAVEGYEESGASLDDAIELYQRFAVSLASTAPGRAGTSGAPRTRIKGAPKGDAKNKGRAQR